MTQSVITTAFETYLVDRLQAGEPVILDEMVLAYLPDLDLEQPIDRGQGLPPVGQIVHRQAIDQTGRVNANAVVYSIVMDTTLGDFAFNAMYLVHAATDTVAMVVHKETEQKIRTQGASQGNSLIKSMLMEYDGAGAATQIQVDAGTWQIDFSARLRGQDAALRAPLRDHYGPAAFHDDAFAVTATDVNQYRLAPGHAYIAGLRAELAAAHTVTVATKPATIYADVYHAGNLLSEWVTHLAITVSPSALADYVDGAGYPHHVTPIARIETNGSITDLRGRGGLWWHEQRPAAHTPAQVGLGQVDNFATASKDEAEAGTRSDRFMTPQRVKEAIGKLVPPAFPAGTRMLFQQTAAPPGWVKETAQFNNHALRVVTGAAGNGGGLDFTAAFAAGRTTSEAGEHSHAITVHNHTLTIEQIPAHSHVLTGGYQGGYNNTYVNSDAAGGLHTNKISTSAVGGNKPHAHGASSGQAGKHAHALAMNVKYVDIIIATKQ
ncbi:phage tail-collar fiber domain-containing protein [Zobellella sp. An-6]|uniref:phage tail-collar fiber domain-containing protein n=1 Tax=Zobellella sp. An-6 TaxID=3400218 RepID=UPI004043533E